MIEWGNTANNLNQTASTISEITSGSNVLHEAILTGLTPHTRYFYRTVTDALASDIYEFITPEFTVSHEDYGFVVLNVTAGDAPEFTLTRVTRGNV